MADVTPAQLRRGYGPIYRWLSRCGRQLETTEKLVLLNLLERQGQNSSAWPVQKTIIQDTGLSERSVRDALRGLEDHGFLTTSRLAPGAQNVYEVHLDAILDAAEHRTGGNSLSPPPPATRAPLPGTQRPPRGHEVPPPGAHDADGLSLVEVTNRSHQMEVTNISRGDGVLASLLRQIGVNDPERWIADYGKANVIFAANDLLDRLPRPFIVYDDDDPSAVRRRKFSTTWPADDGRESTLLERCEAAGIHNPAGLVRSWLQSKKEAANG